MVITLNQIISALIEGRAYVAHHLARCQAGEGWDDSLGGASAMAQSLTIADAHLGLLRRLRDALGGDLRLDGQDPILIRRALKITRADQPGWMDQALRLACASARALAWHRSEPS